MAEGKTYQIYSHEDIRRYLNGEMTSAEMYALEKLAIEDPFLADAIDGYNSISSEAANQDIEWLNQNSKNNQVAKVIPISKTKTGFPWLKIGIAASILGFVVVFGLRYFSGKDKEQKVASTNNSPNAAPTNPAGTMQENKEETNTPIVGFSQLNDSAIEKAQKNGTTGTKKPVVFVKPENLDEYYAAMEPAIPASPPPPAIIKEKIYETNAQPDNLVVESKRMDTLQSAEAFKVQAEGDEKNLTKAKAVQKKDVVAKPAPKPAEPVTIKREANMQDFAKDNLERQDTQKGTFNGRIGNESVFNPNVQYSATNNNAITQNRNMMNEVVVTGLGNNKNLNTFTIPSRSYRFNYQVKDKQGNLIPYTNVSVPADQLVTYTRVDGKFGLFSSDSVLKVNIKAAGYEPLTLNLRSNNYYNPITLDDAKNEANVVVVGETEKFRQKAKSAKLIAKVEEAEPQEGFDNYNSYLANNINITEIPKGEVVLSFDIKKSGEPTNITVNQSLSAAADNEAIRLLSEGPKWKNKKRKKSKGKIVIKF